MSGATPGLDPASSGEAPRRRLISPLGFATAAAVIALVYGVLHAIGLRPYAAILSGTAPPGAGGGEAVALGLAYVIAHFVFVIGAPILAIAAAILWAWERATGRD